MSFARISHLLTRPLVLLLIIFFIVISYFYIDRSLLDVFILFNQQKSIIILEYLTYLGTGLAYAGLFFTAAIAARYGFLNKTWQNKFWFLFSSIFVSNFFWLGKTCSY